MNARQSQSQSHPIRLSAWAVMLALLLSLAAPVLARADGLIVVEPPICAPEGCPDPIFVADQLEIKYHRVDVTIADQVATTKVDQVFHNPNDWVAEGTYLFPVPEGATVDQFTMYVDGEPIEAKILDAGEARRVYDDIVRRMRDPALLEYVDQGLIRASVFPIPPGEDRRIEISYQQILTTQDGLVRYRYGLNTERFSAEPLEQVAVRVSVESKAPVRAVYSPTHQIALDRADDYHFVAGYEEAFVRPDTDFELLYSVSEEQIGASLVSHYDPVSQEGYFLFLAAPGIARPEEVIARDVVIVLDTSGSMEGEKLEQAKSALIYVLDHLNPGDRFNIVEFSTGSREYARELQPVSAVADAKDWVNRLPPTGGTDINLALLEGMAMVDRERPTLVLFLTDGLPTEGEVDVPNILNNVANAAPENVRLFAFGVGDDVDTILLDTLAQAHHGASSYVRPGQALDEIVSAFYGQISSPVLADIELDFGDVQVDDLYPAPLPDLFAGSQMVVLGRYRDGGPATVTLTGEVGGERQTFTYGDQTFATATNTDDASDFLPRLWATRHIGYLLTQIRLNGERQEWVEAIVDLSVKYGIITPYTSYLITEDDILTQAGRSAVADEELATMQAAEPAPASGGEAVDKAVAQSDLAAANVAAAPTDEYQNAVKVVGSRSFVNQDGVWIETTFDPSTMTAIPVQFASADYFDLLALRPDLGEAFALGDRVIALSQGQAFEVNADPAPPLDLGALGAAARTSASTAAMALFGLLPLAGLALRRRIKA